MFCKVLSSSSSGHQVPDSQKLQAHSIASPQRALKRISSSQAPHIRSPSFTDIPRSEATMASAGPSSPRNPSQQLSHLQSMRSSGMPQGFPRTSSLRRTASSPRLAAKLDALPDQRAFILQQDYVNPQAVRHLKQKWSRSDAGRGAPAPSERCIARQESQHVSC
jgi:hypothetical protein